MGSSPTSPTKKNPDSVKVSGLFLFLVYDFLYDFGIIEVLSYRSNRYIRSVVPRLPVTTGNFLLRGFQPFKRQVDDPTRVFDFAVDTVLVNVECLEVFRMTDKVFDRAFGKVRLT